MVTDPKTREKEKDFDLEGNESFKRLKGQIEKIASKLEKVENRIDGIQQMQSSSDSKLEMILVQPPRELP